MKLFGLSFLMLACAFAGDSNVQSNVVYGMYSGAALLLDIHRPVKPNGYGIIYVSGSGWTAPPTPYASIRDPIRHPRVSRYHRCTPATDGNRH